MKFFISKSKKLPREAQKGLEPRKEFMTQGKERFLAAFDASALARNTQARRGNVAMFFKIGVGVMAVLAVGVGLSAYADTANVAATNPLYPLKRFGESVQLALASATEKPQLRADFAVRRANEIAALQASAPSSTLIPQLTSAMEQDISASLVASVNTTGTVAPKSAIAVSASGSNYGYEGAAGKRIARSHPLGNSGGATTTTSSTTSIVATSSSAVGTGTIDVYCGAFDVSTSGVLIGHLEDQLSLDPSALSQFNEQCGNQSANVQNWNDHRSPDESVATTTTSDSASATVTRHDKGGGTVASATANIHVHIPQIGL